MGRPAKPIGLHAVQGTGRVGRLRKRTQELVLAPQPIGDCPEWFSAGSRAEWDLLTKHPEYSQVLSTVHYGTLVEYCVLYARMIEDAKGGEKLNASQRQTLHSLRMQLGITPASQAKVKAPPKQMEQNPFASL